MNHNHIIFVPGKNPKPGDVDHRNLLLKVLYEGLSRIDIGVASEIMEQQDAFSLIPWNYLYYHQLRSIDHDLKWIEKLIKKKGPTRHDINESKNWAIKLNWFVYALADRLPFFIRWLPGAACKTIHETSRYFQNTDNIGSEIRALLKDKLRPILDTSEPVLLIGHSMGSIIIYDALWELSHQEQHQGTVDFLSLGSPLGASFVQKRLIGNHYEGIKRYPKNINNWINVSATGDITALDSCFLDDYVEMLKSNTALNFEEYCSNIYTYYRDDAGLNVHRSYGYLIDSTVCSIISNWWKKNSNR